ncbi:MAG: methyltransferase domain-containing protein [Acidobacteriota bacterium]
MAERVCPVWIGYLLLSPLRKLRQDPNRILGPFLRPGMAALDFGSAMGYFSIPMARLVSPGGKVICADIQERMLQVLRKRAKKANVESVIESFLITGPSINLGKYHNKIDFVLLFAAAHEVPDQDTLFRELSTVLKPGGKLLFSEPSGHVSKSDFSASVKNAESNCFQQIEQVEIRSAFSVLLEKV